MEVMNPFLKKSLLVISNWMSTFKQKRETTQMIWNLTLWTAMSPTFKTSWQISFDKMRRRCLQNTTTITTWFVSLKMSSSIWQAMDWKKRESEESSLTSQGATQTTANQKTRQTILSTDFQSACTASSTNSTHRCISPCPWWKLRKRFWKPN